MFGFKNKVKIKSNITNNYVIPADIKYIMESIINDYLPYCTNKGKSKLVDIVVEYAQIKYNFKKSANTTDVDAIYNAFCLFNDADALIVRHKVHELTYLSEYFTIDYSQQRKEAANILREMFPEYNMENTIESIFPGYGNIPPVD